MGGDECAVSEVLDAGLEHSINPDSARLYLRTRFLRPEMKPGEVRWEDRCGTGEQHKSGQRTALFADAFFAAGNEAWRGALEG